MSESEQLVLYRIAVLILYRIAALILYRTALLVIRWDGIDNYAIPQLRQLKERDPE